MKKKNVSVTACLKPMPMTIVSCRDTNGEENALAVGYVANCSYDPPMLIVGIVPSRYSYHMIKNSGEFVVNLASDKNKALFDYLGSNSMKNGNKLKKAGVQTSPARVVSAPVLTDCPVHFECKVVDSILTGSHEMFVGKIVNISANEELVDDNGSIDFSRLRLL